MSGITSTLQGFDGTPVPPSVSTCPLSCLTSPTASPHGDLCWSIWSRKQQAIFVKLNPVRGFSYDVILIPEAYGPVLLSKRGEASVLRRMARLISAVDMTSRRRRRQRPSRGRLYTPGSCFSWIMDRLVRSLSLHYRNTMSRGSSCSHSLFHSCTSTSITPVLSSLAASQKTYPQRRIVSVR